MFGFTILLTFRLSAAISCGQNEQYFTDCLCEPRCSDRGPNSCTRETCVANVCQCQINFKRNDDYQCVLGSDCPCRPNEEYNSCGTACEPSCDNPNPTSCKSQCVPECQCKRGYLRHASGNCVRPEICFRKNCGDNEIFQNCGTACEPTCENPNPVCSNQCSVGVCQCEQGYVRNSSGNCIKLNACPNKKCGVNEIYKDCGTFCEPTCKSPNPVCTDLCLVGVCQCAPGYARDSGKCITPKQCQVSSKCEGCEGVFIARPRCKVNEEYRECGTVCESTCENQLEPRCQCRCNRDCELGVCQCKRGYFRNTTGNCVESQMCRSPPSPLCGENEGYFTCGTACEPTCDVPNPTCPKQCIANVCQCKSGHVRDGSGQCIPRENCRKKCSGCQAIGFLRLTCPANEEYRECGAPCEPTCEDTRERTCECSCSKRCILGVCQCRKGYVRDFTGKCVDASSCLANPCQVNEIYKDCGTACEPTCDNPNPICTKQCVKSCQCKQGFVRNSGKCIHKKDCLNRNCPPNQEYRECGTSCEPTCLSLQSTLPSVQKALCTNQCLIGVCQCKPGFVRNMRNQCVDVSGCTIVAFIPNIVTELTATFLNLLSYWFQL